jgi:Tectonin domain
MYGRVCLSIFLFGSLLLSAAASAQEWQQLDGAARDVAVGANGDVWVVGTNEAPGGYGVWRRDGSAWTPTMGAGVRVAVGPTGEGWVINDTQEIFRIGADGAAVRVSGKAHDIGVGADGTVWVIGATAETGGYGVYRSADSGRTWSKIPGAGKRISVDATGKAWLINDALDIFRYNGSAFEKLPGKGTDVAVGSDGTAWVVGTAGGLFRFENGAWVKRTGAGAQIAAGPNGSVLVVNNTNAIFQAQLAAPASAIAPVASGPAWRVFPRGGQYEARILQAIGFQRFASEVFMGGQVPAASTLSSLERAFAGIALTATEAYFAASPLPPDQAVARVKDDDTVRQAVQTFIGLGVISRMQGRATDAETSELRQWATGVYRNVRINSAKALLDQYGRWVRNPCGYENLPAIRCDGYAGLLSPPRPSQDFIARAAMGSVLGSRADEVAAASAVGLTAASMGGSAAALTSGLGVATAGTTVSTSLAGAFGATGAVAQGAAIGATAWAGVVAAPVAAAVLSVVVGTIEGVAVVEGARVEPMLKLRLGAAMTENIVLQNALDTVEERDFFFLAFQAAAADGFAVPQNTVDGEVRFFCQAGYVCRFKLDYNLNGAPQTFSTPTLSVGHEKTFPIPYRATSIVASGEWFDGFNWKPLFTRNLARPTYIGFTAFGTIFDARVKDEYPEVSSIQAPGNKLIVTQGGGYVAWIRITYTQGGAQSRPVDVTNASFGWRQEISIPSDATNIRLEAWSATGWVGEPWKSIIDHTWPAPQGACVKVYNTTLDPKWNSECN